jgi:hypothetical protein
VGAGWLSISRSQFGERARADKDAGLFIGALLVGDPGHAAGANRPHGRAGRSPRTHSLNARKIVYTLTLNRPLVSPA